MKLYIIILFLFILPMVSAEIVINEIMYNPEGRDDNREWLEIYNKGDEEVNLTGWRFYEANTLHILYLEQGDNMSILPDEYIVIVKDTETFLQDYENYTGKILDSSFSLSNDGELLIITNSREKTFDSIIDIIYYIPQWGGNGNGKSICKLDEWQECIPTPGNENSNRVDYSILEVTELLPNPKGNDDASMPNGEWVEIYNPSNTPLNLENLNLYDNIGNEPDIIISNSNTLEGTIIDANSYLVVYMNGRNRFLNNEGFEKIRLYKDDYLIDEVSYSGSKEGLSWSKVNNIWIQTIPTPNQENYFEEPDYSSHLTIDNIYLGKDKKAAFGNSLRVRITIYKGDTSKYNLDLFLVDKNKNQVSKRSEINIEDKFTNYTLIVPLQIDPNCKMKYPNGTYTVVLKGLDEKETEEIEIEGITKSLCEIIIIKEKTSSEKILESPDMQTIESQEETFTTPLTSSIIYESSDIKARNIGLYFFCAVLLLLIIYLISKKNL